MLWVGGSALAARHSEHGWVGGYRCLPARLRTDAVSSTGGGGGHIVRAAVSTAANQQCDVVALGSRLL